MRQVLRDPNFLDALENAKNNEKHQLGVDEVRERHDNCIASEFMTLVENVAHSMGLSGHIDNILASFEVYGNVIYIGDHKPSYKYHCNINGRLSNHMFSQIPQLIAYYHGLKYLIKLFYPSFNFDQLEFKCVIYNENDIIEFDPEEMTKEVYEFYVYFLVYYTMIDFNLSVDYVCKQLVKLPWWTFFPLSDQDIEKMINDCQNWVIFS